MIKTISAVFFFQAFVPTMMEDVNYKLSLPTTSGAELHNIPSTAASFKTL